MIRYTDGTDVLQLIGENPDDHRDLQPAVHRSVDGGLRPGRYRRTPRHRGGQFAPADQASLTVAVIIPAHNEQDGLGDTIASILTQTRPADQLIVVDDGSTDNTTQVARSFGPRVTLVQPPANLGSKARAQNFGLTFARTDLVLPVDADTVLADDYIERVVPVFDDPRVMIAAGAVRTRHQRTVWEQGREIEYLFGFHWFRPVQNALGSPTVCSGCCTVFDRAWLSGFGGFPERTMVEDIDATWSAQLQGHRALYVADAVAYAAEPTSAKYLSVQLRRWKSGWFQNVRLHYPSMLRRKPLLALWVGLSLFEILIAPLMVVFPIVWIAFMGKPAWLVAAWWFGGELVTLAPPLAYAAVKRRINPLRMLTYYPSFYVLKMFNAYHDYRALLVEMIAVPLGLSAGLTTYHKGRA